MAGLDKYPHLPLAAALREATRQAHHVIDHHPVLAALLQPRLTIDAYARALSALHGPLQVLEEMAVALAGTLDWEFVHPRRVRFLDADLIMLERAPSPCASSLSSPQNLAALLGYLYVLEGARLGGRFLAAHLVGRMPLVCLSFFRSAEQVSETHWPQFLQAAQSRLSTREEFEACCAAAQAAFSFIADHLDACLPTPSAGDCVPV